MNKKIIQVSECVGRVVAFGGRPDLTFTAKETALFTSLAPIKTALSTAAAKQSTGNRGFRENANERVFAATSLRSMLRDIAEIAKSLAERGEDVGAKEAFRMPPHSSYANLAAAAQAFVDLVEPRKVLFTDRGLAATFVEDIEARIATLSAAGADRDTDLGSQVGGTAGLEILAKQGMAIVRELRSIMRVKLRLTPGLFEEWHSIARVHTNRPGEGDEEQPGGSGSGTGTEVSGGTAPAIAGS